MKQADFALIWDEICMVGEDGVTDKERLRRIRLAVFDLLNRNSDDLLKEIDARGHRISKLELESTRVKFSIACLYLYGIGALAIYIFFR